MRTHIVVLKWTSERFGQLVVGAIAFFAFAAVKQKTISATANRTHCISAGASKKMISTIVEAYNLHLVTVSAPN